ncbi:hypothetical protein CANINC_001035 [Pichia inconspicua]|uniref:Uncharacterized protein n=1 Tax=Pichia inconspicua TaxID=52247 RepID=A0A4T0X4Z6_9ASCO|nr:hypothetical protein CANINC_001035 [[Candida] inconspicua]
MKLSRPGSLSYDKDVTNLKRARTFAGSSSTEHLIHYKTGSSKLQQQNLEINHISRFDENQDIELKAFSKRKDDTISHRSSLKQSGLYPRYENVKSNHFNIPTTLDPRVDLEVNPYSAVTFKIEDNLKTITESVSVPSTEKVPNRETYTKVDLEVQPIKLLPYDAELDLTPLKGNFMSKAVPFFETLEFCPTSTDETGILLKILNHEFECCSKREEEQEFKANCCAEEEEDEIPWYKKATKTMLTFIDELLKSWQPVDKEEYNKRFPWDKFYDPELYYDYKVDELHELNFDMIASDDVGTISKTNSFHMKKSHNYVSKRRQL